jgi:uncharacterized protein YndB with AHSA1/START domain
MRFVHRATTSAPPAEVWALLGCPDRWPEFDIRLRRVRGADGPAEAGQHLLAIARVVGLPVPLDVDEAVPGQRLRLTVHLAPGLREVVTFELVEVLRGGTTITSTTVVQGPFARLAKVPLWVGRGVIVRLLAIRASRTGSSARDRSPGAA